LPLAVLDIEMGLIDFLLFVLVECVVGFWGKIFGVGGGILMVLASSFVWGNDKN
jgi:uncharacterized membrane protein YfcA